MMLYFKRKDHIHCGFSSKDLMEFFDNTFELLETGKSSFVFNVDLKPNEKGLHKISV